MANKKTEKKTDKPKFDLNRRTHRLLQDEPFYCAISMRVTKVASEAIPTAGVRVNPHSGFFEMIYNPSFFEQLNEREQALVLMHEFDHLIFEHVTGRLPVEGMTKEWNHATDLAINGPRFRESGISSGKLYDMALIPGKQGSPYADLPFGKTAEFYLPYCKKVLEEMEKNSGEGQDGQPGNGSPGEGDPNGGFDNHEGWNDSENPIPTEIREMAKERLKDAMRAGARDATAKASWGSVPADMRQRILDALQPKVDWRQTLRYFVRTSQRADKSTTIKKINRRYPYQHPGRKTNRTAKLAISIDQSGSVSDRMLAEFFAELRKLSTLVEFTVIPFDTRIEESLIYTWKKNQKHKVERVMCGGTDFNAPTEYVNEKHFDGHIILTDMCAPKPVNSKCQRMWVTDAQNAKNPYFTPNPYEKIIAID